MLPSVLIECTVSGNTSAHGYGGGIFSSDSVTLTHCTVSGNSDIVVYDFSTNQFTRPYSDAMKREDVQSMYEGLYTILPAGDVIVEDHNSGRILFLAADGRKLGQFINRNPDGKVYQVGWGRYVDQAYGDAALKQIAATPCALP